MKFVSNECTLLQRYVSGFCQEKSASASAEPIKQLKKNSGE